MNEIDIRPAEVDWQRAITERFEIQPTIAAMQRHLLFSLRSASVQTSEVTPGEFQTEVRLDGGAWTGSARSEEEAMGRVLLAMTGPDGAVAGPEAGS